MSEKIKFNFSYVCFDLAQILHPNIKQGQKVEVEGQECRIGDYLARFEQDDRTKMVVIPMEDMAKLGWLQDLAKDENVLNVDVLKAQKEKK